MWRSVGERFRVLRRRLRLRQQDLAELAGVSRRIIHRVEHGQWESLSLSNVQRVADALGARLYVNLSWHGEQLGRLADAAHAELQNRFAEMLAAAGWLVAVEVSFNHYGDRGRYDLLAYHAASGIVLVVEIKTAIGDVQATLGTLDMKVRFARDLARQQGWRQPRVAVPVLVVSDERQQHRVLAAHASLFARFSVRGRSARAWLKRPVSSVTGLLLYLSMTNGRLVSIKAASHGQRVRITATPLTDATPRAHTSPMDLASPT